MPDRPVIVNNTPLVALWSLGQLSLLHELYGDILIPQAVHREFLATETPRRHETLETSPWIHPTSLTNPQQALVYVGLDRGEAEVLALAIECSARFTGTIGVLLAAKDAGLFPFVAPVLAELVQKGLYLSPEILAKARELAGEQNI